jgi:hypothetical protein
MVASLLSDLSSDALHHILEYLQGSLQDLRSIGYTNRYLYSIIFVDVPNTTDPLFPQGGKRYWKNMYNLRSLLVDYTSTSMSATSMSTSTSTSTQRKDQSNNTCQPLGILQPSQEAASLAFDHPDLLEVEEPTTTTTTTTTSCAGYFGFCVLPQEVAVWGDFSGVSFIPSLQAFVNDDESSTTQNNNKSNGVLFERALQVMVAFYYEQGSLLFLGFASGQIHCISVNTTITGTCTGEEEPFSSSSSSSSKSKSKQSIQEYPYISANLQHPNEITSLIQAGHDHLASGSMMNSKVLIHWNALQDGNLDRVSVIHYDLESVLSIASCVVNHQIYLTVGSSNQTIFHSCWSLEEPTVPTSVVNVPHPTVLVTPSIPGHVVFLSYLDQRLVLGTSMETLAVLTMDDSEEDDEDGSFFLEVLWQIASCCPGGCVESVERVGTVLITAGGTNGRVMFWDWDTGCALGQLRVHPGRPWAWSTRSCGLGSGSGSGSGSRTTNVYSSVVSTYFCHERSSLLCLCRDGHVREWSIPEELSKATPKKKKLAKRKRTARSTTTCWRQLPKSTTMRRRSTRLSLSGAGTTSTVS